MNHIQKLLDVLED